MKEMTKAKILGVLLTLITILFFVNQRILKTLGDGNPSLVQDSAMSAHREGVPRSVKPFFPEMPGNVEKIPGVGMKDGDRGEGQMPSERKDVILLQ